MNDMERRALKIIWERYPITIKELAKQMKIPCQRAEFLVKRLEFQGYVITEPLPDKVYLRLRNHP